MQELDQGQGLIVEREGRIKQRVNSNIKISLDRHITRDRLLEEWSTVMT
jgi:hypothetical protein